ncbi:unnamed protein product [Brugia timori]|uniref:Auxin-responsive protein n=1 Tax=Brugia timori TaxID=42155 RepID=A0A0R3QAQ6_9BILA|nr:unnamed protein product [Brugia timori]
MSQLISSSTRMPMQSGKDVSLPGPSTSASSVDAKLSVPSLRGVLYSSSISWNYYYHLIKNKVRNKYKIQLTDGEGEIGTMIRNKEI